MSRNGTRQLKKTVVSLPGARESLPDDDGTGLVVGDALVKRRVPVGILLFD
ncbi:hypothetical protein [Roseiflexus castenholzii]|jgi:hypothetical protein|uniref:hypothetical protein n=1 Tax=Roseiflexus castenholzii TaxID=120962 RepID=UPI0012EDB642|nr:hypothetical protein [Roseiflexus castenholzii]